MPPDAPKGNRFDFSGLRSAKHESGSNSNPDLAGQLKKEQNRATQAEQTANSERAQRIAHEANANAARQRIVDLTAESVKDKNELGNARIQIANLQNEIDRLKAEKRAGTGGSPDTDRTIADLNVRLRQAERDLQREQREYTTRLREANDAFRREQEETARLRADNQRLQREAAARRPEGSAPNVDPDLKTLFIDPQALVGLTPDQKKTLLKSVYRGLSQVHHADHGGDPEKMKRINIAYDRYRQRNGLM